MRLLTLSATGRESSGKVFRLEREDAEDKEVEKRLNATKRLKLEAKVAAKALAETLAERAWERAGKGETAVRVIVFCHSNRTAREVHEALSKKLRDFLKNITQQF